MTVVTGVLSSQRAYCQTSNCSNNGQDYLIKEMVSLRTPDSLLRFCSSECLIQFAMANPELLVPTKKWEKWNE